MNTQAPVELRSRNAILSELAKLPASLQGSISSFTVTSSSDKKHVYNKLQYTDGDKKISIHIPNEKLPIFQEAVENGKRAKALLAELTEVDAAEIVSGQGDTLKKLCNIVAQDATGLIALIEEAAESITENGIACTRDFEEKLHSRLMGAGLRPMEAILTSESALKPEYDCTPGERNGGIHKKDIVTLFGIVKSVPREYFWSSAKDGVEGGRKGSHYVFDEKLGLVGRYTPAVVHDVLYNAASHDYEASAADLVRTHGFSLSHDAIRDIVLSCESKISEFIRISKTEVPSVRTPLAYVLADGTGIHMFHKYLEGVKGKNGTPTTREAKLAAFFTVEMKKGKAYRNKDSTTYTATTGRWEDFGRLARIEFDRRFPLKTVETVYLTDGGKWLRSVHDNFFPFATMVLDIFHALEHLKDIMILLGYREGSDD